MDVKLSEFLTRTTCGDPGLGRDLLTAHQWSLKDALNAYYEMKGIGRHQEGENISFTSEMRSRNVMFDIKQNEVDPAKIDSYPAAPNSNGFKCLSEPSLSSPTSPHNSSEEESTHSSPSKLAVSKIDINDIDRIDEMYPKKLVRGISRATDNVTLVSRARNEFAQDFQMFARGSRLISESDLTETPEYTFTIPDLTIHPPDFSEFLEKDLIEKSTLVSLEGAGRLNWWADINVCQRLWPLSTSGDGNCLLHAASLGMWGFHDRLLTLRKALHAVLLSSVYKNAFYRRWRWQSSIQNKEAGLILCEEEWEREWQSLLKMASTEPRVRAYVENHKNSMSGGKKIDVLEEDIAPHVYESLEEIHILALAHVLKRPIIVIADTMLKDVTGEPFAPIPFGGVYLPLECESSEIHQSPLCLTYDTAHFSALVAMEMETYADKTPQPPAAVPLTDSDKKLLPVQFAIDPGENVSWAKAESSQDFVKKLSLSDREKLSLLEKYLDIIYINLKTKSPISQKQLLWRSSLSKPQLEKSVTLPSNFEFENLDAQAENGTTTSEKSESDTSSTKGQSKLGKSRAARQLHSIGKRFGSLGRSFSRKIRRNISSIARRSSFRKNRQPSEGSSHNDENKSDALRDETDNLATLLRNEDMLIAATLRTEKRHDYQEEMIRNYLSTARLRFLKTQQEKKDTSTKVPRISTSSSSSTASASSCNSVSDNYTTPCVNTGCKNFGSASSSYLCSSCLTEQQADAFKMQNEKSNNNNNSVPNQKASDLSDTKMEPNESNDNKVPYNEISCIKKCASAEILPTTGVCVTYT